MAMDPERIKAELDELDQLPYGPERIAGHLRLAAEAEQGEDHSLRCKLLIWLSDDYMETDDKPRMIEFFDRAWAYYRAHAEQIDPHVRYNLRTTFAPVVTALDLDPEVPDEEVVRRLDEMDAFYREGGYSMRIPYRTRHWFHRRRGEQEEATRLVELLVEEPGDAGAHCDAMGPMVAAQWYQGPVKNRARAAELWQRILELPDQRCAEDHRAQAFAELAFLSLVLGRPALARSCHRAGYPLIRRAPGQWRALDLHMIYANRVRDVAGFLRIVHDHVELLEAPLDDDVAWYHGRVLQFLHLLCLRGHAQLPITLPDRSETTADRLRERLDAGLAAHAAGCPDQADRERYTERLASWREETLHKVDLPAEQEDEEFWESVLPPVPAPWAAPPDLEDLPKGWTAQDALLAEARVLAYLDHPHLNGAWARVAALGTPRSLPDRARLTGYRAAVLMREHDFASARTLELEKARIYQECDRPGDALVSLMIAALSAYLTGDQETALAERDEVVARARTWHAAGRLTDGDLMALLVNDFRLDSIIEIKALAAGPDRMIENPTTNEKFTAVKDLYLSTELYASPWADMLGAWAFLRQNLGSLYGRYGLAPGFVAETADRVDFWYAKARDAYRDALQFPQQADAELKRGQNLLKHGRFAKAEEAAVEAARLNAGVDADLTGPIALLRAEAIARQVRDGSRDEDLLAAAREAAVLAAGEGSAEAAYARILVADVHRRAERHSVALEMYADAVEQIGDGWGSLSSRAYLRRATAGRIVSLRRTGASEQARELLKGLYAQLPDWNKVTVGWIHFDAGEAFSALGEWEQAAADYGWAARLAEKDDEIDPRACALERLAALTVARDPQGALALVDQAVAWIGKIIEAELAEGRDRAAREAAAAAERGHSPQPAEPPRPDPRKLARLAEAKAAKVRLLIDPEPAPDEVLGQLLPAAYREAAEAAESLAELLRAAHAAKPEDPWREELMTSLETGVGWVATVQAGLGDRAGAAGRFTALAEVAEECALPGFAATARENAAAMAPGGGRRAPEAGGDPGARAEQDAAPDAAPVLAPGAPAPVG
jgi:tetratricopeptide (TPR) repeat protein